MKTVDIVILSAAAAAAVLIVRQVRRSVPTTAANRAIQQRAEVYRAQLGRELAGSPDFWV